MPLTNETQIREAEERLRLAMLHSDVGALDELISPNLIFTTHLGKLIGKQDDLDFHQSGIFKLKEISPSEQHIQLHSDFSVVSVLMHLSGTLADMPFDSEIRYTRVWSKSIQGHLQIVAGHASSVAAN